MKRLSSSIGILLNSKPELLFSSGSSPRVWMNQPVPHSSIYDLVNGSMSEALKSVVVKESDRIYGEELAVTVLVTGNVEKLNRLDDGNKCDEERKVLDFLDVWLHLGAYSPLPLGVRENAASLALVGPGRDVAAAKYSDWVRYLCLCSFNRFLRILIAQFVRDLACGLLEFCCFFLISVWFMI